MTRRARKSHLEFFWLEIQLPVAIIPDFRLKHDFEAKNRLVTPTKCVVEHAKINETMPIFFLNFQISSAEHEYHY